MILLIETEGGKKRIGTNIGGRKMSDLNKYQRKEILDTFGVTVINEVRDRALRVSIIYGR